MHFLSSFSVFSRGFSLYPRSFKLKLSSENISYLKMSSGLPKILVTRSDIPKKALDKLKEKCDLEVYPELYPIPRDILLNRIQGKDGLFCLLTEKIDKEVLDAAGKNLKVICTMSVGHEHLELDEIKKRGIKVGFTPGVLTDATAELTIGLLLATNRRLFEAHNELLNGGWAQCAWSPLWMTGVGLSNSTVGVFGLGRIGQAVVKRLQGFNVHRFIYNARSKKSEGDALGAEFVSFEQLLKESDFLVVTSELNEQTKGIFGKDALSLMKKSAVFINTSRGGLVDQDALMDALKSEQIRAAGLDVMTPEPLPLDHPLITTPNITLLPHIGSADVSTREAMALLTADNLLAGLGGTQMPHRLC